MFVLDYQEGEKKDNISEEQKESKTKVWLSPYHFIVISAAFV